MWLLRKHFPTLFFFSLLGSWESLIFHRRLREEAVKHSIYLQCNCLSGCTCMCLTRIARLGGPAVGRVVAGIQRKVKIDFRHASIRIKSFGSAWSLTWRAGLREALITAHQSKSRKLSVCRESISVSSKAGRNRLRASSHTGRLLLCFASLVFSCWFLINCLPAKNKVEMVSVTNGKFSSE